MPSDTSPSVIVPPVSMSTVYIGASSSRPRPHRILRAAAAQVHVATT